LREEQLQTPEICFEIRATYSTSPPHGNKGFSL